jgi:hypothetical protein
VLYLCCVWFGVYAGIDKSPETRSDSDETVSCGSLASHEVGTQNTHPKDLVEFEESTCDNAQVEVEVNSHIARVEGVGQWPWQRVPHELR